MAFSTSIDTTPRGKLSKPTYRVIKSSFDNLETEIRRRDWYVLEHVTQCEGVYTLFFRLKDEFRSGEHVLRD